MKLSVFTVLAVSLAVQAAPTAPTDHGSTGLAANGHDAHIVASDTSAGLHANIPSAQGHHLQRRTSDSEPEPEEDHRGYNSRPSTYLFGYQHALPSFDWRGPLEGPPGSPVSSPPRQHGSSAGYSSGHHGYAGTPAYAPGHSGSGTFDDPYNLPDPWRTPASHARPASAGRHEAPRHGHQAPADGYPAPPYRYPAPPAGQSRHPPASSSPPTTPSEESYAASEDSYYSSSVASSEAPSESSSGRRKSKWNPFKKGSSKSRNQRRSVPDIYDD